MRSLRHSVVPAYVLLCLILGGSAQGIWSNALLQLLAIAIIAWSLLARSTEPLPRAATSLFVLAGLTAALVIVQLIPLSPELWSGIPGRGFVAEGYLLLGQPLPWLPISLAPYNSMATGLTLLPPIAVLCGMLVAGAYQPRWLVCSILLATLAGVLVGALQVASADPVSSPWYFYEWTSFGVATGFFANANHMASLLVVCIPLLLALIEDLREGAGNPKAKSAIMLLALAGVLVLLVGIVLNGSLAVLLLGPPVLALSASLLLPRAINLRVPLAVLAGLGGLAMLWVYLSPVHDRLAGSNATSMTERQQMWAQTAPAVVDFMPLGSGIGSFPDLYPRFENPAEVTTTFASHAHNDYLEIALETGLPGLVLVIAFLLWWGTRTQLIWRSQRTTGYAQAATIATAALLLHSLVDFPLRTAGLSALMAACLALMAHSRGRGELADLWPTRHLTV